MDFNDDEICACSSKLNHLINMLRLKELGYNFDGIDYFYITDYDPNGWNQLDYSQFISDSLGSALGERGGVETVENHVGAEKEYFESSIFKDYDLVIPTDPYDGDDCFTPKGLVIFIDNFDINTIIKNNLDNEHFYERIKDIESTICSDCDCDDLQYAINRESGMLFLVTAEEYIDGTGLVECLVDLFEYARELVKDFTDNKEAV